jgi:glycosyltransferase involved in cell wall biosynthesis
MRMKILFLTNLLPFPLDNGGKIKTFNTIRMLAKDHEIDLVTFYEEDGDLKHKERMAEFCKNVFCFQKKLTTSKNVRKMAFLALKGLLSRWPFVIYKYCDIRVERKVAELVRSTDYDLFYCGHLQLYPYFLSVGKGRKILDQHNCESMILKRMLKSTKNPLKKLFLLLEFLKLSHIEKAALRYFDRVTVLSDADLHEMLRISRVRRDKFDKIPIVVESQYTKNIDSMQKETMDLLFLGTLSWYPNQHGILWFLSHVLPLLKRAHIPFRIHIVGKNASSYLVDLVRNEECVNMVGYVDDVNEYYEKCDILVVPLFIGSGMRVKILEGLAKGIPIISTEIGCEGIAVEDGKSILIANEAKDFVLQIERLRTDQNLGKAIAANGLNLMQEQYSFQTVKGKLRQSIAEVLRSDG